jgi:hypothetical protein
MEVSIQTSARRQPPVLHVFPIDWITPNPCKLLLGSDRKVSVSVSVSVLVSVSVSLSVSVSESVSVSVSV